MSHASPGCIINESFVKARYLVNLKNLTGHFKTTGVDRKAFSSRLFAYCRGREVLLNFLAAV
jgi:hypothetical protein